VRPGVELARRLGLARLFFFFVFEFDAHPTFETRVHDGRHLIRHAERRVEDPRLLRLVQVELALGPQVGRDAEITEPPLEDHLPFDLELLLHLGDLSVDRDVDRPLAGIGQPIAEALLEPVLPKEVGHAGERAGLGRERSVEAELELVGDAVLELGLECGREDGRDLARRDLERFDRRHVDVLLELDLAFGERLRGVRERERPGIRARNAWERDEGDEGDERQGKAGMGHGKGIAKAS